MPSRFFWYTSNNMAVDHMKGQTNLFRGLLARVAKLHIRKRKKSSKITDVYSGGTGRGKQILGCSRSSSNRRRCSAASRPSCRAEYSAGPRTRARVPRRRRRQRRKCRRGRSGQDVAARPPRNAPPEQS
jgi:hypothetical protein